MNKVTLARTYPNGETFDNYYEYNDYPEALDKYVSQATSEGEFLSMIQGRSSIKLITNEGEVRYAIELHSTYKP